MYTLHSRLLVHLVASVADDTVTEGQLHTWMKGEWSLAMAVLRKRLCVSCLYVCNPSLELFLVELCGETDGSAREQYWLSLRVDGLSMLDHVSKVMRWEWPLTDVQEFTLDAYMGRKRLVIKVGR